MSRSNYRLCLCCMQMVDTKDFRVDSSVVCNPCLDLMDRVKLMDLRGTLHFSNDTMQKVVDFWSLYGGSFEHALASAYYAADTFNRMRIERTWITLIQDTIEVLKDKERKK